MRSKFDCRDAVIAEARTLATFLIEWERAHGLHDIENALHRAASRWGIDQGALRSIRYRWRELQDVKASLLERMREAYETIYERQRRKAEIERGIMHALSGDEISRGGRGAQDGEAVSPAASSTIPARLTLSRADDQPAKQCRNAGAELQLEEEL